MKIKVLYEDANLLVIDKPSGISVHSDGKNKEKTITDWVLKNYPKMENVGEPALYDGIEIKRPGVVHRLDKGTSGVLVLVKNQKTHALLKEQFSASALEIAEGKLADRQNKVKKVYVAVVQGWIKNDKGIVDKPIGRSPSNFRRRLAGRGARGALREAITEYKVLKRFSLGKEKFTYVEVTPKTGRTHQIRVHMKYLNHPVVCDTLYNPDGPCPKAFSRLALHAKSIEFKGPKGKLIQVESPLPSEFTKI